jgi:hypothetical protein
MLWAVGGLAGVITVAIGKDTERLPEQPGLMRLGWRDDPYIDPAMPSAITRWPSSDRCIGSKRRK